METRREMCATGDHVPRVRIKQEVEWQVEVLQPMDLVNQELQLGLEPLPSINTEADFMSKNKKTVQKRCLTDAAGEQVPNVLIKEDVEWLAEDSHAPANIDSLESIKSEEDHSSTPDAQTPNDYNPTKTELTSDEEFVDEKKDTNSGSSTETNNQRIPAPAHGQRTRASISDKQSGQFACHLCQRTCSSKLNLKRHKEAHNKKFPTCEVCGATFTRKRYLKIHMLRKHLDTVLSYISGPQTADDDSIGSDMEEFFYEGTTSFGQSSPETVTKRSESNPVIKSVACEVCHCIYPSEYIRIHMGLAHSKPNPSSQQPKHKCGVCSRLFMSKRNLEIHLNTHATDRKRKFACHICERDFYHKNSLLRHMTRYAQKDHPKSSCEVCLFSFTRKGDRDVHLLTQHLEKSQPIIPAPPTTEDGNQQFPCDLCERTFSNETSLRSHIVGKHVGIAQSNTSGPQVAADDTENTHAEQFLDKESLCYGQASQEGVAKDSGSNSDISSGTCEVCHCIYAKEYIPTHMRLAHSKNKCEFIDEGNDRNSVTHVEGRQQSANAADDDETQQVTKPEPISDEEFIDEGSDKGFDSHAEGSQQPVLVAEDEQRAGGAKAEDDVSCEVCDNTYPQELINTHMRVMHGVRARKCPFCPKVCSRQENLKSHISTHDNNPKRPYSCEQCGVTFSFRGSLRRHIGTQHSKKREPEFNCELCERKFYTKPGLKGHMENHIGVTFSCRVCGKTFTRKQGLRNHIAAVHSRF